MNSNENSIKDPIVKFISDYLVKYPESEVRDIYKLLYQAYHGPEHFSLNTDETWMYLEEEWNTLGESRLNLGKVLLEPIFINGVTPGLFRLNLAPAKALGINPRDILDEFLRTAKGFPECYPNNNMNLHESFINAWKVIGRAGQTGEIVLDPEAYKGFSSLLQENEWVAAHHSEQYRKLYKPHYRLVLKFKSPV